MIKNEKRINKYIKQGYEVFEASTPHTWIARKGNEAIIWTCFGDLLGTPYITTI